MARRPSDTKLPAPFLKSLAILPEKIPEKRFYPFDLPWLTDVFEFTFKEPVTIIAGENGSGKSTLIEAIAAMAGFGEGGGSRDHAGAVERSDLEGSGRELAMALRGAWLPKVTQGWFFRAETFFSVARYLDDAGSPFANFLSASHGEGFIRVFEERMSRKGLYLLDEPESALSPNRQIELLRMLAEMQNSASSQVIMVTHSPLLMAVPGADLYQIGPRGLKPADLSYTDHYRLYYDFFSNPAKFVQDALDRDDET